MAKKQKFYVVWQGREPGVYRTWEECRARVNGCPGARYKAYPTEQEALAAYRSPAPYGTDGTDSTHGTAAPDGTHGTGAPAAPDGTDGTGAPAAPGGTHGTGAPAAPHGTGAPAPPSPSTAARRPSARVPLSPREAPPPPPAWRADTVLPLPHGVRADAIAVDAACSGNPGPMEYRGVDLATGQELFRYGPVHGTNNVGEFLAIVHALAWLHRQGLVRTVYTDSRNALLWVRAGKCRTRLARAPRTEPLYRLIARAEAWLQAHPRTGIPLLKWHTGRWGEIPADFGRKG